MSSGTILSSQPSGPPAYVFPTGAAAGLLLLQEAILWRLPQRAKGALIFLSLWRGPLSDLNRRSFARSWSNSRELARLAVAAAGRSNTHLMEAHPFPRVSVGQGQPSQTPKREQSAPPRGGHHERQHR